MKYYAKLDENNIVLSAITLAHDIGANEVEDIKYLTETYGWSNWKRTYRDENPNPRLNYATSPAYKYDPVGDRFIATTKPYDSWVFNESTGRYDPPIPMPTKVVDGFPILYTWNEAAQTWEHGPIVHADGTSE